MLIYAAPIIVPNGPLHSPQISIAKQNQVRKVAFDTKLLMLAITCTDKEREQS